MKKMKKIFLLSLFSAAFCSCKKEYNCVCKDSSQSFVAFTVKATKGKAQQRCTDYYNEHYGAIVFNDTKCEVE
jgi:hypothetical protein